MTPLEKAARALCEAQGYVPSENEMARAREEVRAVLQAIREPSSEMARAGFHANTFENKHGDKWGCPGVTCDVKPPDDWFDPANAEAVKAFVDAPKCRIARIKMPATHVWQAMIDAALSEGKLYT